MFRRIWVLLVLLLSGPALAGTPVSLPPEARGASPPASLSDRRASIETLLAACLLNFALGDLKDAERACSKVLLLDQRNMGALKLRGYAFLVEHRFEQAAADFRAGLRVAPADDELLAGHARSLSGLGRFAKSAAQFRLAVNRAPAKAPYWAGLCWSQAGTGRGLKQALAACDRALRLEPGTAGARNARALVLLRMHDLPHAIADYTLALKAQPRQATARFGLGLARLQGSDAAGAADIREARRMDEDVDRVFIDMHVLPENCDHPRKTPCPPGFPARPPVPTANILIVKKPATAPGLHLAHLPD